MDAFDQWVGIWIPMMIIGIGTLGNLVCLFVLSCDKGHNSLFLALKALVASDLSLLIFGALQQIIPMLTEYTGCVSHVCLHWIGHLRIYTWPVVSISQMSSAWLTILISTERYVAICNSPGTEFFRKLPNVRFIIITIVVAAITFNIPKFFEYVPQEILAMDSNHSNLTMIIPGDSPQRHDLVYRFLYNMVLTGFLVFVLPIICLLWLNTRIMLQIRHMLKFAEMNRQMRRKLKATRVPIGIFVVFCICNLLALISFVSDAVSIHSTWLQHFMGIANMFVLLNAAVNFVIFYLLGSKFQLLCKRALGLCLQEPEALKSHQESPLLLRRFQPLLTKNKITVHSPKIVKTPIDFYVTMDSQQCITCKYSAHLIQDQHRTRGEAL